MSEESDDGTALEIRALKEEFYKQQRKTSELRDKAVFIGGNYAKNESELDTLSEKLEDIGMIPVNASEVDSVQDPDRIHEESLRLLHNCKYAVIDVSDAAGQFLELERARDYGVVTYAAHGDEHSSAMVETLTKRLEDWNLGYQFSYTGGDQLEQFVEAMFRINHSDRSNPQETIKNLLGAPVDDVLLITSVGAFGSSLYGATDFLDRWPTVIMTGWDKSSVDAKLPDSDSLRDYEYLEALVCEGCVVYEQDRSGDYVAEQPNDESAQNHLKRGNRYIIEAAYDIVADRLLDDRGADEFGASKSEAEQLIDKPPVFYSGGHERSIAYYVNPPEGVFDKIVKLREDVSDDRKEKSFAELVDWFEGEGHNVERRSERNEGQERKISLRISGDTSDSNPDYWSKLEGILNDIEKANSKYRPYLPYSVNISGEDVFVGFKQEDDYEPALPYGDVKRIRDKAIELAIEDDRDLKNDRIAVQHDNCINIFYKTKAEILEDKILDKYANKDTPVVYLSKGTESDIPMIFSGYASSYNFVAVGPNNVSDSLRRAGVIPLGVSVSEVLEQVSRALHTPL